MSGVGSAVALADFHCESFDRSIWVPLDSLFGFGWTDEAAAALAAKGYDYQFLFSQGTGHCDGKVFDETLADTLVWMWRGYHAD